MLKPNQRAGKPARTQPKSRAVCCGKSNPAADGSGTDSSAPDAGGVEPPSSTPDAGFSLLAAGDEPPAPAPVTASGIVVSLTLDGTDVVVVVDGTETRTPLDQVASLAISGTTITIGAGVLAALAAASAPVTLTGSGAATLTITGDGVAWLLGASGSGTVTVDGATLAYTGVTTIAVAGADATLTRQGAGTAVTWTVDGAGAGDVDGVDFSGFAHLVGAAADEDQFIVDVAAGGSIATVDGGTGGNDTLELRAAGGRIVSTPSGADQGVLAADALEVGYDNLEPLVVSGTPDQVAVTTTTADDVIEVSQDTATNQVLVRSTIGSMEQVTLVVPESLFEILASAPNVTVRVIGDLFLPGVTFRIVAAHILIGAVTIDTSVATGVAGDIEFAAGTSDDAVAEVVLTGTTLTGRDITVSATATAAPASAATVTSMSSVICNAISPSSIASWKCAAATTSPEAVRIRQSASKPTISFVSRRTIGW